MFKRTLITGAMALTSLYAQSPPTPKPIPRFHLDHEGWGTLIATGAITGLDHWSTQRLLDSHPRYYEGNSFIATKDGRVDYSKAIPLELAQLGSHLLYQGVLKHHVPSRYRWLVRIPVTLAAAYRLRIAVNNIQGTVPHKPRY